jgi:hypothetical protein
VHYQYKQVTGYLLQVDRLVILIIFTETSFYAVKSTACGEAEA